MAAYETLVEALNDLKAKGYTTDFNIAFDKLKCTDTNACLTPDQFEITDYFRFEGMSNPDDDSIVYVVEAKDGSMKGTLVNAYGIYADPISEDLIEKLSTHPA